MNNTSVSESTVQFDSGANETARLAWIAWAFTSAIAAAIVCLIIGAPLAEGHAHAQLASAIYKTFGFVCHQLPDRSFHLAGHPFAVCSRCTGLYSGFAVAALLYPLSRSMRRKDAPRRIWLVLAAVPIAIDFALGYFAIWPNTHFSRFTTGALLGSVAVFYIMPGLVELSSGMTQRSTRMV
jgi:uncharacterized membrane protein